MAVQLVTGYEHGALSSSGGGVCNYIAGTASVQSAYKRSGNYALALDAGSANAQVHHNFADTSIAVIRFYVRVTGATASSFQLMMLSGTARTIYLYYYPTLSKFRLYCSDGYEYYTAETYNQDEWHRIDIRADGTNGTCMWQVDGNAQTYPTGLPTGGVYNSFRPYAIYYGAEPRVSYFDDIYIDSDNSLYPLGDGEVVGLVPDADGTHSNNGSIQDASGNVIDGSSCYAYEQLDTVPIGDDATYVKQASPSTGSYAEVNFSDLALGTVRAVQAYLGYKGEGTNSNHGACNIRGDSVDTLYDGDMSEASAFYKNCIPATPSGGWTLEKVNALQARLGYSSDANPDPYWLGLMLEVEYVPSQVTPISVSDSGAGADSLGALLAIVSQADAGTGVDAPGSLDARIPIAETGAGADAIASLLAALVLAEAGSGIDAAAVLGRLGQADSGVGAEGTPSIRAGVQAPDSGAGADGLPSVLGAIQAVDAAAGIDAIAGILADLLLAESGAGADSVSKAIQGIGKNVQDSGAGVDVLGLVRALVGLTEGASGWEGLGISVALEALQEAGSGLDGVSKAEAGEQKQVADSGAGSDLIAAIVARLLLSDAGAGVETVLLRLTRAVADSGVGAEALVILARLGVVDSGAGVDTVAELLAGAVISDLGTGADSLASIRVLLTAADLGAGADAVSKWMVGSAVAGLIVNHVIRSGIEPARIETRIRSVHTGRIVDVRVRRD